MDQAEQIGRSVPELSASARPSSPAQRARVAQVALPVRQRGWIGLIVLLIGLVIVAMLAQTMLKSSGMLGAGAPVKAGNRVPGPAAPAEQDTASVPATPVTAIERARGVEQTVQKGAEDMAKRIDEQTK